MLLVCIPQNSTSPEGIAANRMAKATRPIGLKTPTPSASRRFAIALSPRRQVERSLRTSGEFCRGAPQWRTSSRFIAKRGSPACDAVGMHRRCCSLTPRRRPPSLPGKRRERQWRDQTPCFNFEEWSSRPSPVVAYTSLVHGARSLHFMPTAAFRRDARCRLQCLCRATSCHG